MMERFTFVFVHLSRTVDFGPYEDEDEAKTAFQRIYGYWPQDAIHSDTWLADVHGRRVH